MKKQLLLLMLLSFTVSTFAEEVKIGALWYELITKAKEAKVIKYKEPTVYSGNIIIPDSVEYDGITYSVTSIDNSAFLDCTNTVSVIISDNVIAIGDYAFYNCSKLSKIVIGNNVTTIGDYAFRYCSRLTSVTIPQSVRNIGVWAFESCSGLTSVHVADLATWCSIIFRDNYSNPLFYARHLFVDGKEIKDLVIPDTVTSIGTGSFRSCSGLTSVTIPNSVTSIGKSAFAGCSGVESVTLPNSVTSIGEYNQEIKSETNVEIIPVSA